MSKITFIILLFVNAFLSSISQVLLKKAALQKHDSIISQYLNVYVIAGYGLFFLVLSLNVFVMKYLNMSIVSIFSEAMPLIMTMFLGALLFNERINKYKIISIIMILIGIVLIIV